MNITIKKVPAIAATSSVTNIRKECDNNGMSPDNTAQISHALSFIITSQHYIQFRHLKLCQPKFWFISRVSKCRCSWHVSGEGDPTRGSEQHHPWHCWHSLSSLTPNIDLTLTPLTQGAELWPWLPGYITRLQRSPASAGADPSVKTAISPSREKQKANSRFPASQAAHHPHQHIKIIS